MFLLFTFNFNEYIAQTNIAAYKLENSISANYIPINGGTVFVTGNYDNEVSTAINMGGTFSFGGVDYTTCYIHANGYITFGTPLTPTTYTPISTLGTTSGAISAFGVNGAGSSATGATSASPLALAAASPLAVYSYVGAENTEQEQRAKNEGRDPFWQQAEDALKDEGRDAAIGLPGDFVEGVAESTAINQAAQREAMEFTQEAAAREAAGDLAGAANARIAQGAALRVYHTPWKGMLKGLGIGLAAGVVNFGIDQWSNSYEDKMHKGSQDSQDDAERSDKNNNIGIAAIDA